jgi:hypothetical protein
MGFGLVAAGGGGLDEVDLPLLRGLTGRPGGAWPGDVDA